MALEKAGPRSDDQCFSISIARVVEENGRDHRTNVREDKTNGIEDITIGNFEINGAGPQPAGLAAIRRLRNR